DRPHSRDRAAAHAERSLVARASRRSRLAHRCPPGAGAGKTDADATRECVRADRPEYRYPTYIYAYHIHIYSRSPGLIIRMCGDILLIMAQFRISEAAAILGVSDDAVRRWVDRGLLESNQEAYGCTRIVGLSLAAYDMNQSTSEEVTIMIGT